MANLLNEIVLAAQASQRKWSVPSSVTLAQYGLESSWGTRMPEGSNNPFGIKAKPGEPAVVATTMDIIHKQPFRKYASIAEAFDDHGALLNRVSLYKPAIVAWKRGDVTLGIQLMAKHYATDPKYATKLLAIINSGNLTAYDRLHIVREAQPAPAAATQDQVAKPTGWLSAFIALLLELFRRK